MHLAAQYLRVVLLFFSYGDKRFWSRLRFDSRNFSSLPAQMSAFPHPPVSFLSSTGHTIRAPSVHLSQITSVSISFLFCFLFFSLRVHKSSFKPFSHESKVQDFDKSRSTDKPLRSETKTCLGAPYVRGTSS